nr:TPA_asm: hypothetical protein HUJ06_027814 [Nelumbo nucifera]
MLGPTVLGQSETLERLVYDETKEAVLNTLSELAMLYMYFLVGVKMETNLILKPNRNALKIGLSNFVIPFMLITFCLHYLRSYILVPLEPWFLVLLSLTWAISSFPAIAHVMDELNLLTSELGKLAMSCAIVNDMVSWSFIAGTTVFRQKNLVSAISAIVSVAAFLVCTIYVLRPGIVGIIRKTPEGNAVGQSSIVIILLGVLVTGFIGDVIGITAMSGAFALGVIIPEGSTLGVTVVERTEIILGEILLPFFFLRCGLFFNIFKIRNVKNLAVLEFIIFIGRVGKLIGTMLPCNLNAQHSLCLALMLNTRGIINVSAFRMWRISKVIDDECFTIFVLNDLLVTALTTPLLTSLYKPPRYFATHAAGTIQNARPNHELRIVACLHDDRSVNDNTSLIEAFHPTSESPIYIYVLHLVKLVGRSLALVADPSTIYRCDSRKLTTSDLIMSAFRKYSDCSHGTVGFRPFTIIAPYKTMHEDICKIAHDNRASLILLPFQGNDTNVGAGGGTAFSNLIQNVLTVAPCSVGLLVGQGYKCCRLVVRGHFSYSVLFIFFGGPDDRETLALCSRMSAHPGLSVTVIRFQISDDGNDNEREKQLDESVLHEFRLKNIYNDCAVFREEVVNDVEQALLLIRSLKAEFELVMVGRRHGACKMLSGAMEDWSENSELGVLGDMLASSDFLQNNYSLLVVQAGM